jgi:hypothetical protein
MKKDYSGWPGDCSPEQLKVLEEFRAAVTNMGCTNPPYDDAYLLRFLRARKFDLTKALQMWSNFIKWRQENSIDSVDTYDFSEIDEVKKFYPHAYFRTDRKGRPIYIERVGQLKLQNLFKVTTQDRLVKYYCQSYERLLKDIFPACSKAAGQPIAQTCTILDLKGGSMSMMSSQVYNFVQLASKLGQDYYPEILGQMFIVNAPMLFTGVWAVIKPWIDEKTRNKIKILGSKYEKELFEVIDPQNLPDFLGGKVPVSEYGPNLDHEQGPWVNNERREEEDKNVEGDDEERKEDFSELKNALSGLKLGGSLGGAKPQPKDESVDTKIPADTPLNTQIDDDTH